MTISISLNQLQDLKYLKNEKSGIHIVATRTLNKIIMIEVSLVGKGFKMSNAGINRITSQLFTKIGEWIGSHLDMLQKSSIEEIRIVPTNDKFITRLSRKASSGKFSIEHATSTPDGGIKTQMKEAQFIHHAGDPYLHYYLPKRVVVTKTKQQSMAEIRKMFDKTT